MPDINAGPVRRFENGGKFTIKLGANSYVVLNITKGSLTIREGHYAPVEYQDRGENQDPIEGDERMSEIELECGWTGNISSNELRELLTRRDTATGKMQLYELIAQWPDYKGAATGEQVTFAKSYVAEPPELATDVAYDKIRARFRSCEPFGTWATY